MSSPDYEDILEFWFGTLSETGAADAVHTKRWFTKDPSFDREIVERFGSLHGDVAAGRRDEWLSSTRGRLAFVIVLDQFSRNMFRGDPRSFATDRRALEVALRAIDEGDDKKLGRDERTFLYMPLMHSEERATQKRCVELFTAFRDELPPEEQGPLSNNLRYAVMHRDIIERFGRFPHRNAVLGRTSTIEEFEFLKGENSSF
jgi:uncharacterized protein (DUF924 family)